MATTKRAEVFRSKTGGASVWDHDKGDWITPQVSEAEAEKVARDLNAKKTRGPTCSR